MRHTVADQLLDNGSVVSATQAYTAWVDVHDLDAWSLLVAATKVASGGDLTFTVQAAGESAAELNGTGPYIGNAVTPRATAQLSWTEALTAAATKVLSATNAGVLLSKIPQDTLRSIRVGYKAATADATDKWTGVYIWLLGIGKE